MEVFDLSILRAVLAMTMLGTASFLDLKNREVHDYLWILFGGIAGILILLEDSMDTFLLRLGYSLIIAPIAVILWRIGFFGGADSLGLIVLAGLAPLLSLSNGIVTPLTVLTNAAILSLTAPMMNTLKNLMAIINHEKIFANFDEPMPKKIVAFFLGHKAKQPAHSFSIEKYNGLNKRFDFSLHHSEKAEYCTKPNTWVTPGIPFLLYIAGGFVLQLFVGDVILNFLTDF